MNHNNSTYSLLVRSEEKSRSILETIMFTLSIVSAIASIWQFAQQPVVVPANGLAPKVTSLNPIASRQS